MFSCFKGLNAFLYQIGLGLVLLAIALNASSDVLHLGNDGEPSTLDPHRYNLRLEETLLNDLFMGLTTFTAAGQIAPGAAESWTQSEDGKTWTFKLRTDGRWSDGEPVTASDFVYSMRRLLTPSTAASLAYFLYMIENAEAINRGELPPEALGVTAEDPLTLRIRLAYPYPYLLERLLYPTAFPVPRHVIERVGKAWTKAEHWVSNGAYKLAEWRPQAYVEMVANPFFHAPAPIKTVRHHALASEQSGYNRFRNGELAAIPSFPASELTDMQQDRPKELRLAPLLSIMYLVFNTQKPPFHDPRVRKALGLVIQQQTITQRVLRNGSQPSLSMTPSLIRDYQPVPLPHADLSQANRVGKARDLLAQAGYNQDHPLRVTLKHVNSLEGKKINLAIAAMWRQLGVETTLAQSELRAHFADLRQGSFEVAWAGWVGENNPEHYLSLLRSDIGNVNYGRYRNSAFDDRMAAARRQADATSRGELLRQAEQIMVADYPVVPLYMLASRRLVNASLQGWQDNVRNMHQSRYLFWSDAP